MRKDREFNKNRKNKPKVCIVIPTYNEAENIEKLVRQILDLAIPNLSIIIVDDNSPDETGKIVEKLKARGPKLRAAVNVIHRKEKLGLGTAYVAGFKQALEDGVDYMITMDADFSHKPHYIINLLEKLDDFDLVIGSRYIPGGDIKGWQIHRVFISKLGNFTGRKILGLKTKDLTSGFRCYSKELVKKIGLNEIGSKGYSYLMEMLFCCEKQGYRVKEIPIHFGKRDHGESKISGNELIYSIKTLFRLRAQKILHKKK